MTRPFRAALPTLLLLLASVEARPAWGQTSLGQPGSLPPPRPAAPSSTPAPPPTAAPAAAPRPQPAPARPPAATPPRPPAQPQAGTPPRPATPQATAPRPATPTLQQRPGTSNSAQPARPAQGTQAANANRRRAAGAAAGVAAGTAAGAAGAAALGAARPPEPAPAPQPPPVPRVGSATGLPLPRFAALGSNQVNLRIGPDLRYRIEWTYQRKDLPVQIVEEHQIWRRIRDPEGTEGWVQRPLLTSRRTFLVQGEERVLRRRPEENADPVARLKPGVIGAIRKCEEKSPWCEARVGEYSGWIRRSEVWGLTPEEAVN